MAAMALRMPELQISEAESKSLADAVILVSKEYGVKLTGKAAASLNLLVTAAVVYGPKALAIFARGKVASASKAAPQAVQAFDPSAPIARPDWMKGESK